MLRCFIAAKHSPRHSLLVDVSGAASGQACVPCLLAGFGFRPALGVGGEVSGSSTHFEDKLVVFLFGTKKARSPGLGTSTSYVTVAW